MRKLKRKARSATAAPKQKILVISGAEAEDLVEENQDYAAEIRHLSGQLDRADAKLAALAPVNAATTHDVLTALKLLDVLDLRAEGGIACHALAAMRSTLLSIRDRAEAALRSPEQPTGLLDEDGLDLWPLDEVLTDNEPHVTIIRDGVPQTENV